MKHLYIGLLTGLLLVGCAAAPPPAPVLAPAQTVNGVEIAEKLVGGKVVTVATNTLTSGGAFDARKVCHVHRSSEWPICDNVYPGRHETYAYPMAETSGWTATAFQYRWLFGP